MKMKAEYDFSKAIKNPYYNASSQISMSLSQETLKYFKDLAKSKGVSFEEIIAALNSAKPTSTISFLKHKLLPVNKLYKNSNFN